MYLQLYNVSRALSTAYYCAKRMLSRFFADILRIRDCRAEIIFN